MIVDTTMDMPLTFLTSIQASFNASSVPKSLRLEPFTLSVEPFTSSGTLHPERFCEVPVVEDMLPWLWGRLHDGTCKWRQSLH